MVSNILYKYCITTQNVSYVHENISIHSFQILKVEPSTHSPLISKSFVSKGTSTTLFDLHHLPSLLASILEPLCQLFVVYALVCGIFQGGNLLLLKY